MKHIILFCFIFAGVGLLSAQDCNTLSTLRKGTYMVNSTYNANDKYEGKAVMEVLDITSGSEKTIWKTHTETYSKKDKLEHEGDVDLVCENGVLQIDLSSLLKQVDLEQEGIDVSINNEKIEIPSNLSKGQDLSDAKLELTMNREGTEAGKLVVNITNRKVEGKQHLEVPAGEYEVYKISYDIGTTIKVMGMEVPAGTMKIVEYFSPEIGAVKTERYSQGDKLQTYTVLTEFTR